jgi:hypothetical protein
MLPDAIGSGKHRLVKWMTTLVEHNGGGSVKRGPQIWSPDFYVQPSL